MKQIFRKVVKLIDNEEEVLDDQGGSRRAVARIVSASLILDSILEKDRSNGPRVRDHCVIAGTDNDNKRHGRRDLARRGRGRLSLMRTRRQAPKRSGTRTTKIRHR